MDIKRLNELAPKKESRKRRGTGAGSGRGGTSTRGHKGAKARSGGTKHLFEGGSMPLFRRVPKRGFSNQPHKVIYECVKLEKLAIFEPNATVTPDMLRDKRLVRRRLPIKILGNGEIDRPLTVKAAAFTKSALDKIEKAGGKAEVIQ